MIESEQAANSVINHSNLFSEKIAKNFKSGVPWTELGIILQSYLLTKALENASTYSSTSCHVFQLYSPNYPLSSYERPKPKPYLVITSRCPRNRPFGLRQTDLLKHFQIVSQPWTETLSRRDGLLRCFTLIRSFVRPSGFFN